MALTCPDCGQKKPAVQGIQFNRNPTFQLGLYVPGGHGIGVTVGSVKDPSGQYEPGGQSLHCV